MSAKKQKLTKAVVTTEALIYIVRGQRVMLDADLARLYEVETGQLNRAVQRNRERFPEDFMFPLTAEELANLKCQIGTSSFAHGGRRRSRPYVFTQEGIAMLSSVLRSPRAIEVNIAIMRAFVRMREMALSVDGLARRVEDLEHSLGQHGHDIKIIFDKLRELLYPPAPGKEMGFHVRT
jgi:ORF6N domain